MKKEIPILYKYPFVRWIISNLVATLNIKKNLYAQFVNDVKQCYPISTFYLGKKEINHLYKDFLDANMKHGVTEVDYFTYEYYLLSDYGREKFLTERDRGFFHRNYNDKNYWDVMSNKYKFYKYFNNFINRKILFITDDRQYSIFLDFCNKVDQIIVKPVDGEKGQGIHKLSVKNSAEIENAWKECLENNYLVEEVLVQDSTISRFHPESINTIRIATAIDNEKVPHIMSAVIRVGANGSITDNASSGGLFARIDIDNGIIISMGLDLKAHPFLFHPTSKVLFLGYQIPHWQELKDLAIAAASVVPQMRYVGWDWVLTDSGKWELLEGNEPGGAHIIQQGSGYGLYQDYYKVLVGED